MRNWVRMIADWRYTVAAACGWSLALGLFFIFVWAPHPWGWGGIDFYHQLSLDLARGLPFTTTDVPWGFAYFVAICYWIFGERAWVPLVVQAVANAFVPLMLYHLVLSLADRRTAVISAVLAGIFSFNTVYASTQASDAMCTVIFLASLLSFARGVQRDSLGYFALSGVLAGLAPQFRPNLILLPPLIGGLLVLAPTRGLRRVAQAAIYLAIMVAVLSPWAWRNYQLTGVPTPTSTHGGEQLWYGTLQVGPYIENRARNPRTFFESAAFDYTSIAGKPIVISAECGVCGLQSPIEVALVYWTDRDPRPQRLAPRPGGRPVAPEYELPAQPDPTTIYYYFEGMASAGPGQPARRLLAPTLGEAAPFVSFVSTDHLGDLDTHHDLLDIFDVVRLLQYLAWQEPVPSMGVLDRNGDGRLDETDLVATIAALLPEAARHGPPSVAISVAPDSVTLSLADGSTLTVPRRFPARQTDLEPAGDFAGALVSRWRSIKELAAPAVPIGTYPVVDQVSFNRVFYRGEPHGMSRYTALAFDNISREPLAFVAASLYRMVRLFIIRGTDDVSATQQFANSGPIYLAGTVVSAGYLLVFLAGVVLAWRQRSALLWLLVPIAYVPLTICFVLTNMRYTITVQSLMFVFVAVVLVGMERKGALAGSESRAGRA